MKKINKIWTIAALGVMLCFVLQSCGSSRDKYGCPERIHASSILP